ncbi:unnamed protein product [Clonostachys rhizophaga]|uniref:SRR1-like domain-containing protein n=1 Tax=Clonostachys rhizophaga TaxID=160324 RepID=A0A9N9V994_9HYPO|nr:unnamed protein product [Clonostachys rhizophaga]
MEVMVEQIVVPRWDSHRPSRRSLKPTSKPSSSAPNPAKARGLSKQNEKLFALYLESKELFYRSALARRFEAMLHAKSRPRINKIVSLGLGSLGASKDQPRRMKQLAIFMAIASHIQATSERQFQIPLYAQDPSFTKTDEDFLNFLGVHVLRTPEASDLGEAGQMIDGETLIYSPFLTIEAYGRLFAAAQKKSEKAKSLERIAPVLIGDDFNALKLKWEKRTAEHRNVESLMRGLKERSYQRRVISGEGFWTESDNPFPMALYWRQLERTLEGAEATAPLKGKL